jgi:arginase family enzyme
VDRAVTCVRARTSDRTPGAGEGAEALARLLGGRIVGEAPADPRPRSWEEDLPGSRPALDAAAEAVGAALDGGRFPVLTASDCTICLATFPAVARRVPDVRFLWLDAHGDFNTPATSPSGYLGGMCLAAACGRFEGAPAPASGRRPEGELAFRARYGEPVDPRRVTFVGVRDLDPGERAEVEAAGVGWEVPADGPVYLHLDVDALDPAVMPAQFPVPGGMTEEEVRALLESLRPRLVGLEVTALEHPEHAGLAARLVEAAC